MRPAGGQRRHQLAGERLLQDVRGGQFLELGDHVRDPADRDVCLEEVDGGLGALLIQPVHHRVGVGGAGSVGQRSIALRGQRGQHDHRILDGAGA